jgi:hypothetical protein
MHGFSVWIRSGDVRDPQIEQLEAPASAQYCAGPVISAPQINGLSDSRIGDFYYKLGLHFGGPLPLAINFGLQGLCIVNQCNLDALNGEDPIHTDSLFWRDVVHLRSATEVAASGRQLMKHLAERSPEIVAHAIENCRKGSLESDDDVLQEIHEQTELLVQHLEWIDENRFYPVVSMLFTD